MLRPTRIGQDDAQIVTFRAHRVRPLHTQIWRWKSVRHCPARCPGLTHLVVPLQDMRVSRSMGAIWSAAAEFTVVVTVVTVRAKYSGSGWSRGHRPVLIQHVSQ